MSALPEVPATMKKAIGAYMREASAIQKADPLMAYFCRFYAMQQAIPLIKSSPQAPAFLDALMLQLERDKASMDAKNAALGDSKHATEFTLKVFAAADREDRAGKASANTARTFMAAAAFFDVLQQFGALPSDLVDMRKYCKWKAADILKAVKEGRKPDVGGPLSAEEKELNAMMAADAATLPDPEFASASSSSTTKLSPRLNSAPPATTAASNPTVHPPPKGNSAATTDDDLHLPSVPSSLTSSEVNIAPPDAPTSFDDDISSLLGNMPSVPKPSANKPPAASHQQPPTAPPPTVHLQPPPASSSSTTTTTAPAPPSYQSSVAANVAANTAEIRQMYESMLRAQSDQMLLLHQEQEKQMQELRALSERQAAQIAKLAAAPPASGASSSGGARKPAQHSFVTAAAAAAAAKQEDGAAAAVARMPEVHIPGAVSELLPVEKIDTELAFKHAKYIVSSLQYDDYTQAFKELKMVAKMLCGGDALMLNEAIPKK